jgi:LAS seventeen-binding protein 5
MLENKVSEHKLAEKSLFPSQRSISCLDYPLAYPTPPPTDPPPYTVNPIHVQRCGSSYKRSSQIYCPSKTKTKTKLRGACPVCVARYIRDVLRAWVESQRKPYTAITVQIDRLTSEQYEENDIGGIVDLIEVIRIQESGPTEAARALRKKLYVLCLGCLFSC